MAAERSPLRMLAGRTFHVNRWWSSLQHTVLHACITMLAVGIAFALPQGAQYILYQWWPKVVHNADLLLATEIALAAALALLFNFSRIAWENRLKVRTAETASLVYARDGRTHLARRHERRLIKNLPAVRDVFILTLSGFDTFADAGSLLREPLYSAYEIRIMLLNPAAGSAARRVNSPPVAATMESFMQELEASIACLEELRALGKKVTLKFYDDEPFWKVAVLGEHVWVQYCLNGAGVKDEPEYVFALNQKEPRQGLFVPFYTYFLEHWSDPRHPEFDFVRHELVYRDGDGSEVRRVAFGRSRDGNQCTGIEPESVYHSQDRVE